MSNNKQPLFLLQKGVATVNEGSDEEDEEDIDFDDDDFEGDSLTPDLQVHFLVI